MQTHLPMIVAFMKVSAKSCQMHAHSNSPIPVTNLNFERHHKNRRGSDLALPLTAITLTEEENSLCKMTLPPTRDQICWFFFFFFLGEINTLAAHSHSHTAKLAVTKDIKLSSSEVPLSNVFAAYKYIYMLCECHCPRCFFGNGCSKVSEVLLKQLTARRDKYAYKMICVRSLWSSCP